MATTAVDQTNGPELIPNRDELTPHAGRPVSTKMPGADPLLQRGMALLVVNLGQAENVVSTSTNDEQREAWGVNVRWHRRRLQRAVKELQYSDRMFAVNPNFYDLGNYQVLLQVRGALSLDWNDECRRRALARGRVRFLPRSEKRTAG